MWSLTIWTLISLTPTSYNITQVKTFSSEKACKIAAKNYNKVLQEGTAKCEKDEG